MQNLNIKKIKPMFNSIVTTKDLYEDDKSKSGLIVRQSGALKEHQTVVAVGNTVMSVKVGDLVCINPKRFAVKKHQEGSLKDGVISDNPVTTYMFDTIVLDGKQHLILQDRDIEYIVEEYEVEEVEVKKSDLYIPQSTIIGKA